MKDASGTTATLVAGAAGEAFKNVGYDIFERLTTTAIKAIRTNWWTCCVAALTRSRCA